jgi:hypothetical protein
MGGRRSGVVVGKPFTLPPTISASTWAAVSQALWLRVQKGATNREGIAVIEAIRGLAPAAGVNFATWYSFAASAYGWDAWGDRDQIDPSPAQADRTFAEMPEVHAIFEGIAKVLDRDRKMYPPTLHLDESAFADPSVQGAVVEALRQDGAIAEMRMPTGKCRDRKSGETRFARVRCDPKDADGTARRKRKVPDGMGGIMEIDCDVPGDCDPVTVDLWPKVPTWVWVVGATAIAIYLFAPSALGGAIAGRVTSRRRRRRRN